MLIRTVVVGYLETNCYLVSDKETGDAVIIDPGADNERILKAVREKNLTPKMILLTHGHHDHIGAMQAIMQSFDIPVLLSEKEAAFINIPATERAPFGPDAGKPFQTVSEGDEIPFGGERLKVIFTPGHTPGGVCYLSGKSCFTGDTLFCDGVGRTDFEGGDSRALMDGIAKKLLALPDDTKIFPGHGPDSTIGREKRYF